MLALTAKFIHDVFPWVTLWPPWINHPQGTIIRSTGGVEGVLLLLGLELFIPWIPMARNFIDLHGLRMSQIPMGYPSN